MHYEIGAELKARGVHGPQPAEPVGDLVPSTAGAHPHEEARIEAQQADRDRQRHPAPDAPDVSLDDECKAVLEDIQKKYRGGSDSSDLEMSIEAVPTR